MEQHTGSRRAVSPDRSPGPGVPPLTCGDGQVTLSWTAAPEAAGYDVLRGSGSGGPYARVNQAPIAATSFASAK